MPSTVLIVSLYVIFSIELWCLAAFSLFAAIAGGVGRKSIVFTGKPTTRPQSHDIEKLWWALVLLSQGRSYGPWNHQG